MDLGLRGSTVLLAGGTRGIGLATARLLGEEGARVVVIGRDTAALDAAAEDVRTRGGEAFPIRADLTDAGQAARVVEEAARALGTFDAMIHAVGRGFRGAFLEIDEATWRQAFELDLFSVVRLVRLGSRWCRAAAALCLSARRLPDNLTSTSPPRARRRRR